MIFKESLLILGLFIIVSITSEVFARDLTSTSSVSASAMVVKEQDDSYNSKKGLNPDCWGWWWGLFPSGSGGDDMGDKSDSGNKGDSGSNDKGDSGDGDMGGSSGGTIPGAPSGAGGDDDGKPSGDGAPSGAESGEGGKPSGAGGGAPSSGMAESPVAGGGYGGSMPGGGYGPPGV